MLFSYLLGLFHTLLQRMLAFELLHAIIYENEIKKTSFPISDDHPSVRDHTYEVDSTLAGVCVANAVLASRGNAKAPILLPLSADLRAGEAAPARQPARARLRQEPAGVEARALEIGAAASHSGTDPEALSSTRSGGSPAAAAARAGHGRQLRGPLNALQHGPERTP
jgi:hypothetical protein